VTLLRHAACLLLGLVVSLGALVVHRSAFPLGLLLALVSSLGVPWWLLRSGSPRTAVSYVVGWLLLLGLAVIGRPEGDYVLAADVRGYGLLGGGFVLVAFGVVSFAGGRGRRT
jgi:hypothetical protein